MRQTKKKKSSSIRQVYSFIHTMTKACFKHPLLSNPVKWLRNDKYHSPEFYTRSYYDTNSINSNPFAQALRETRMDGSRVRYPEGQMVQIVVDSYQDSSSIDKVESSENKNYFLMPLINKPEQNSVLYPSHYILKNQHYIDYIVKTNQWRKYVPQKFRFKNDKVLGAKVNILPDIAKTIPRIYKQNILKLMSETRTTDYIKGLDQEYGFVLNFSGTSNDPAISFDNKLPIINMNRIMPNMNEIKSQKRELFLSFEGNADLCFNLFSLAGYYS